MNPNDLDPGADGAGEELSLRDQLMAAMQGDGGGEGAAPSGEGAVGDIAPVEPAAQPDRNRDPQGRFAKPEGAAQPAGQTAQPGTAPAAPEAPPSGEQGAASQDPAAEPAAVRPPPGWSATAKAAFDALPPAVKDAVAKREAEVNQGFAKLAEFKGLDEFAATAKKAGFSVGELGQRFLAAEQKLATNFLGGVHELAQTFGHHPVQVAAGLIGIPPQVLAQAVHLVRAQYGGQQGAQPAGQSQQHAGAPALPPQLLNELSRMSQAVNGLVGERVAHQKAEATSVVEAFFNDPQFPYATNLESDILALVSRDPDARKNPRDALARAYQTAAWANPETRQLLIDQEVRTRAPAPVSPAAAATARQSQAAAQARRAAGSITGSPATGAAASAEPAATLRDEIRRAMASQSV